jgi:CheY-like chemotaxis protein
MKNRSVAGLPVVALTANVINGAREMFMDAGFNDFISKPIEIERLERSLKTLLPKELVIYKNQ